MKIFYTLDGWRKHRKRIQTGTSLGFVPTMGALHKGHMSLVEQAKKDNDLVMVSIYVNPTQFNDLRDLQQYPKTWDEDVRLLEEAGVDFVLVPKYDDIYPDQFRYKVEESDLSSKLCGAARPGHFEGVLTIVLKLLMLAKADKAYFGEKDYQQLLLIKGMAQAFFLETEIVGCPTVRETDGLAFSSRNLRLSKLERDVAPRFHEILSNGESLEQMQAELESSGFKVDYLEEHGPRRYGAVFLGKVRLIDNVII